MSEAAERRPVLTLAALYGAGGTVVGPRVAERLGVPFLDREIPAAAARESGLPEAAAALGEPVHRPTAGGELDRSGAVVGGELVGVAEPADVAGIPDEHAGDDRSDPEQLGERRL
jgi:hypothetical protein